MMKERAHQLLMALEDAGFEAYVVGGAVRDLLMGRTPHDYDIATSPGLTISAASPKKKAGIRQKSTPKLLASSSSSSTANL